MSSQLPAPVITTEEVRFSRTLIEKKTVSIWFCKCGRPLGEYSAKMSMRNHGKIICGECAQKEDAEYQVWKKEQEMIMYIQEA